MPYTHIRPLEFGEVLDGAFALYRRHFVDFFLTALIPLAPFGIFYARLMADGAAFDPTAGDAMSVPGRATVFFHHFISKCGPGKGRPLWGKISTPVIEWVHRREGAG